MSRRLHELPEHPHRLGRQELEGIMEGFAGYDLAPASRNAGVPIRVINGDLWPTATEGNRKVVPDYRRGRRETRSVRSLLNSSWRSSIG